MRTISLLLLLAGLLIGGTACGSNAQEDNAPVAKEPSIVSITLTCVDLCSKSANPPFHEKTFSGAAQIETFRLAIKEAKAIAGVLDYGAIFHMDVVYDDGSKKSYTLNVDDDPVSTALLVNAARSEQGFTISKERTEELRKIIYGD